MQDLVVVAGEIVSAVSSGAPNYRVETVTEAHISLTGDSHVRLRGGVQPPQNVGREAEMGKREFEGTASSK